MSTARHRPETPSGEATYEVICIGMGPVGLTMAALLGQAGHPTALVERHLGLYGRPRAAHIDDEITRVLQSLDCEGPVVEQADPITDYHLVNAEGDTLLEFNWGGEGVSGWPTHYMQYQPLLDKALSDRIAGDPNVTCYTSWELVDFHELGDHVEVVIRKTLMEAGNPRPVITDEGRVLRARYLVGADGANSTVRSRLKLEREDLGFDERWLVVDALKKREIHFDLDELQFVTGLRNDGPDMFGFQLCDPRRPATILPLGKRHRRWEWSLLPGEEVKDFHHPEAAWRLLGELGVGPEDVEIVRQVVYTFESKLAVEWRGERSFLIGDAAHTMPPFMGQGMCAGMRDAKNLTWKLDLVLRDLAPETLLDTYTSERRPHARDWTVLSIETGKLPCITDPDEARERDARFRAGWRPPMPAFPALTTGIIARDGSGEPRAPGGQLGLQARVERDGSLGLFDNLFDSAGRWQVLSTQADPREVLDRAQVDFLEGLGTVFAHVGERGAARDAEGRYSAYFAEHGIEALISRPDFWVFGGSDSLARLPSLVGELQQQLGAGQAQASTLE